MFFLYSNYASPILPATKVAADKEHYSSDIFLTRPNSINAGSNFSKC
jgi:hypothetical protein